MATRSRAVIATGARLASTSVRPTAEHQEKRRIEFYLASTNEVLIWLVNTFRLAPKVRFCSLSADCFCLALADACNSALKRHKINDQAKCIKTSQAKNKFDHWGEEDPLPDN